MARLSRTDSQPDIVAPGAPGTPGQADPLSRVGGVALANGIVFYSPKNWAAAVRTGDGTIKVASGEHGMAPRGKGLAAPIRRLIALSRSAMLLPQVKGALPQARLPFSLGTAASSLALATAGSWLVRRPGSKVPPLLQELASAVFSVLPILLLARRSGSVRFHGAEHKAVAALQSLGAEQVTAEAVKASPREHLRCGTNLAGILIFTSALTNWVSRRLLRRASVRLKPVTDVAAVSAALEVFNWATRNPGHPAARAVNGFGLGVQHFFTTQEPGDDELEVSWAALQALLDKERESPSP